MRWTRATLWSTTSVRCILRWCSPSLASSMVLRFSRSVVACFTKVPQQHQLQTAPLLMWMTAFSSGIPEVHAVLLVKVVPGFRSLLCVGGHGWGERLLWGALCKDGCSRRQRGADGVCVCLGCRSAWLDVASIELMPSDPTGPFNITLHLQHPARHGGVCGLLSVHTSLSAEAEV